MYCKSTEIHVHKLKPPPRTITMIIRARSQHLARKRPKCPIDYTPPLVQTMAWCLTGDNPLSSDSWWCRFGTRKHMTLDTWDAMRVSVIMMVADALHPGHPSHRGLLAKYVKLRVAHAPGIPGTFFPPPRVSDPTCIMASASRDARVVMHVGIANYRFPLKSVASKNFLAHAQPAIFVSRKMPMLSHDRLWQFTWLILRSIHEALQSLNKQCFTEVGRLTNCSILYYWRGRLLTQITSSGLLNYNYKN